MRQPNWLAAWSLHPLLLQDRLASRLLVRQIKWELILLLIVLLLCMTPTAGLFRWSFRWLPFFHLVLAICAAEALRLSQGRRPRLHGAWSCRLDRHRSVDLPHSWLRTLFRSHGLLLDWRRFWFLWNFSSPFRFSIMDACRDHVFRASRDVSLHPDKQRSSNIQFFPATA